MFISEEIMGKINNLSPENKKKFDEAQVPETSASIPENYEQISKEFESVCNDIGITFHEGLVYKQFMKQQKK
jgi:hypothetical protein